MDLTVKAKAKSWVLPSILREQQHESGHLAPAWPSFSIASVREDAMPPEVCHNLKQWVTRLREQILTVNTDKRKIKYMQSFSFQECVHRRMSSWKKNGKQLSHHFGGNTKKHELSQMFKDSVTACIHSGSLWTYSCLWCSVKLFQT